MTVAARTLVAGIGNIIYGADGVGVAVAQRLAARPLGPHVRVLDSGIRGLDLAYELLGNYDHVIFVDALPRGRPPGTLCVLEPEIEPLALDTGPFHGAMHGMHPEQVLTAARAMGAQFDTVRIVGCEPADLSLDGLSAPVAAAVDDAVQLIEDLIVGQSS
jgi:hydrogenase maturation protease